MWKYLCKIMFGILVFSAGINAESLKTLKSFSADFTQTLYSSEKNQKPIIYKGKIEALAPSSAYWNYLSPIPKEIFIQDNTMILYEPKLKQAIITRLQENMNLRTDTHLLDLEMPLLYMAHFLFVKYNYLL